MTTYDTWDDIPNGVTVYAPWHKLLVIKLSSTTLVSPAEYRGITGWIQTTGRYQGPFRRALGGLVSLEVSVVPKPEPRQWDSLLDVPQGVKRVLDCQGDRWRLKRGRWQMYYTSTNQWREWPGCVTQFRPYTEIVK